MDLHAVANGAIDAAKDNINAGTVIGGVGGAIFGGPMGAVSGAAAGTRVGEFVEDVIDNANNPDSNVRDESKKPAEKSAEKSDEKPVEKSEEKSADKTASVSQASVKGGVYGGIKQMSAEADEIDVKDASNGFVKHSSDEHVRYPTNTDSKNWMARYNNEIGAENEMMQKTDLTRDEIRAGKLGKSMSDYYGDMYDGMDDNVQAALGLDRDSFIDSRMALDADHHNQTLDAYKLSGDKNVERRMGDDYGKGPLYEGDPFNTPGAQRLHDYMSGLSGQQSGYGASKQQPADYGQSGVQAGMQPSVGYGQYQQPQAQPASQAQQASMPGSTGPVGGQDKMIQVPASFLTSIVSMLEGSQGAQQSAQVQQPQQSSGNQMSSVQMVINMLKTLLQQNGVSLGNNQAQSQNQAQTPSQVVSYGNDPQAPAPSVQPQVGVVAPTAQAGYAQSQNVQPTQSVQAAYPQPDGAADAASKTAKDMLRDDALGAAEILDDEGAKGGATGKAAEKMSDSMRALAEETERTANERLEYDAAEKDADGKVVDHDKQLNGDKGLGVGKVIEFDMVSSPSGLPPISEPPANNGFRLDGVAGPFTKSPAVEVGPGYDIDSAMNSGMANIENDMGTMLPNSNDFNEPQVPENLQNPRFDDPEF